MVEQVKTKSEPHVRFRGFTDEWEEAKLLDEIEVYQPKSLPQSKFLDEGYPVYGANGMIGYYDEYNHENRQIAMACRGNTAGVVNIIPEQSYITGNAMIMDVYTNNKLDFNFMGQLFNNFDFTPYISGSGQPQITRSALKGVYIQLPSLDEQQAIGELFQTLDSAIDLSNTQVENLKQQKKSLLQRLYPQKGETEPKVRLRGFTDDWNEVKLGDVVDTSTGKLNANAMTSDGAYPFFTCAKDVYLTDTYSFDDEALIIAGNGDMGAVKYYNGKFDAYQRTYVLTKIKGDAKYLEYCLSVNLPRQIHLMTYGSTMPYITKSTLTDMAIRIPSLEEQQAIGELFQTVDEQIRLAEDKVSQYKELKQALSQRLFV